MLGCRISHKTLLSMGLLLWLATTKQVCRDELVVYLSFSSHNIYIYIYIY